MRRWRRLEELRNLQRMNTEYEKQNAALLRRIENINAVIKKFELESFQQSNDVYALPQDLNELRQKRKSDDRRASTGSEGKETSSAAVSKPQKTKRLKFPKDANAPRQPLSGYVRYLNEHRERVKEANPQCSFTEITKLLASEWSSLPADDKRKYLDEAVKDKERYHKELEHYQQSESYKLFVQQQKDAKEKLAASSQSVNECTNGDGQNKVSRDVEMTDVSVANANLPSFDIPIFTEEFLDHNKARENELRQLRKLNSEYEEQNAILSKHIENMKAAIEKLEVESVQQKNNNAALSQHLSELRNVLVTSFAGIAIPGSHETPTMENIDNYMQKLYTKLIEEKGANKENEAILKKVQNIISHIDYNFQ
ncbi:high mobility group protein 20A-like protein [Dinothrombium tinctorium]|uniref:High mobility group protein 20A-like protein n=2 Tax=Dinothrombium tinctorium TaxID=1965070 RepID=A0A3S3QS95_9ACAR|nr:high mobility group protein 20A-like protein [Dinothrombium tinctorium]RWS13192.1 high mobility group protein 20A-like protein [Dinothrombium tinctorium]